VIVNSIIRKHYICYYCKSFNYLVIVRQKKGGLLSPHLTSANYKVRTQALINKFKAYCPLR